MYTSAIFQYNKLFELSDPFLSRPLRLTVRGYSEWVSNDYAKKLFRGSIYPGQPIKLGGYRGGQPVDLMWSDLIFLICISERVIKLLRDHNITGWSIYPVEVYGRQGELIPGYYGFSVTGCECRRDRSRSEIITKQAVPGGKPYQVRKGLYFIETDWDGSDIFLVSNSIIVTEKVRQIIKKEKITNVRLTPLPDVERDVYLDRYEKD